MPDEILHKLEELAKTKPYIVDVLRRVTQYYHEIPDDNASDTVSVGDNNSAHTTTPLSSIAPHHEDPFDDILEAAEVQLIKEKQKKAVNQHVIAQVERNMENMKVGQIISEMSQGAIKDISKKADVRVFFYVLTGIVVGNVCEIFPWWNFYN